MWLRQHVRYWLSTLAVKRCPQCDGLTGNLNRPRRLHESATKGFEKLGR
jgi:hypothetical protein